MDKRKVAYYTLLATIGEFRTLSKQSLSDWDKRYAKKALEHLRLASAEAFMLLKRNDLIDSNGVEDPVQQKGKET